MSQAIAAIWIKIPWSLTTVTGSLISGAVLNRVIRFSLVLPLPCVRCCVLIPDDVYGEPHPPIVQLGH